MIEIENLFKECSKHIATCKSAPIVCNIRAAFESWFRVELIVVLLNLGYSLEHIETNYTYSNSSDKADLCIRTERGDIVFELKSFVDGQDSNKKTKYPNQIKKLESASLSPTVAQVLTFTTFIGYSENKIKSYVKMFFQNNSWRIFGPIKLLDQYRLFVILTSISK